MLPKFFGRVRCRGDSSNSRPIPSERKVRTPRRLLVAFDWFSSHETNIGPVFPRSCNQFTPQGLLVAPTYSQPTQGPQTTPLFPTTFNRDDCSTDKSVNETLKKTGIQLHDNMRHPSNCVCKMHRCHIYRRHKRYL